MRHHSCRWQCVRGLIERLLCSCYYRKLSYDAVPPPGEQKPCQQSEGLGRFQYSALSARRRGGSWAHMFCADTLSYVRDKMSCAVSYTSHQ